jgi:hypothetical protein
MIEKSENRMSWRTSTNRNLLNRLHAAQLWRCFYCSKKIYLWVAVRYGESIPQDRATVDHFIPLSLGGADAISNVVLSCQECNSLKGNQRPTAQDIHNWNALSKVWKHISKLSASHHARDVKRCLCCDDPIPQERFDVCIENCSELTAYCSSRCATSFRNKRKQNTKHPQLMGTITMAEFIASGARVEEDIIRALNISAN